MLAYTLFRNFQGPLHAVLGYASMLQEEISEEYPEAKADIKEVTGAATFLNESLGEVFNLVRIELDLVRLMPERISVPELLQVIQTETSQRLGPGDFEDCSANEDLMAIDVETDIIWSRHVIVKIIEMVFDTCGSYCVRCTCDNRFFWINIHSEKSTFACAPWAAVPGNGQHDIKNVYLQDNVDPQVQMRLIVIKKLCEALSAQLQFHQAEETGLVVQVGFSVTR